LKCNDIEGIPPGFKNISSFIPQDDILISSLSARETFFYAAKLRLPPSLTNTQRNQRVEEVLKLLSLESCSETRIGNVDQRGISGGQRKRVSIGVELIINPSVIFLDEPTSGLDSKMAEDVTDILRNLAKQRRNIICTIHQPSYKIFMMFDRVLLLSEGFVMYQGATSHLPLYFSQIGYEPPNYENPCDFVMRLLQDTKLIPEFRDKWTEIYSTVNEMNLEDDEENKEEKSSSIGKEEHFNEELIEGIKYQDYEIVSSEALDQLMEEKVYAIGRWDQFWVLLDRTFKDYFKDRSKFFGGLVLKLSVGILVGVSWYGQAGDTNSDIFPTTGALFLCVTSSVMDTLFATVMAFPQILAIIKREYRNSSYSLLPFFLSQLLSQMIFQSFYAIFLGLPIMLLVGLEMGVSNILIFFANLSILACMGASLGEFYFLLIHSINFFGFLGLGIGALVKDFFQAQQTVMPTVVPLLLFSGYVIPYNDIPSGLSWLYYVSFFQYSFSIFQINQVSLIHF